MSGEVIDVVDGKTVRIMSQTGEITVELQYIDVPGPGQELYQTVKDHLRSLTKGKVVSYRPVRIAEDRSIGRVMLNDVDLSMQMIRDGAAWHVMARSAGQGAVEYDLFQSMEAAAKAEKRGVWSIPGLKPAAESSSQNASYAGASGQRMPKPVSKAPSKPKPGPWSDINPALGDVGALLNGYNARTQTGYISTSLLGIKEVDANSGVNMAVDFTYHYKEAAEGRKGVYVMTVVAWSKSGYFAKHNQLSLVSDEKVTRLGTPKRTAVAKDGAVREVLTFQVSRQTLESVGYKDVILKVGDHLVYPAGMKYLIMNLLQAT